MADAHTPSLAMPTPYRGALQHRVAVTLLPRHAQAMMASRKGHLGSFSDQPSRLAMKQRYSNACWS